MAHINRAKSKNAFEHVLGCFRKKAFCSLHVPKSARKYFCFLLDWCAPVISITKESTFEHVLTKALLPKAALLDWSAPSLTEGIPTVKLPPESTNALEKMGPSGTKPDQVDRKTLAPDVEERADVT